MVFMNFDFEISWIYCISAQLTENMPEEAHVLKVDPKKVIAEINHSNGREPTIWK